MSTSTNGQYVQIPDLPIADAPNGSEWIETIQLVNGVLKSYRMPVSSLLILGKDGLSAYEVAQKNGFRGTEAEWLASLNGKSAFDIVRETHPEIDTQDKFINFITGPAGKSAYEIAKQADPQIVLSKLNLVEDNELDAVWKVNYRADIVEANGYQRDRGVIPEY